MDELDQLFRRFDRVVAQTAYARQRLKQLEDLRTELRQQIQATARGESGAQTRAVATTLGIHESREGYVQVLEAIRGLGRAATVNDVVEKLGIKKTAAYIRLSRAAQDGILQRVGYGKYLPAGWLPEATG